MILRNPASAVMISNHKAHDAGLDEGRLSFFFQYSAVLYLDCAREPLVTDYSPVATALSDTIYI